MTVGPLAGPSVHRLINQCLMLGLMNLSAHFSRGALIAGGRIVDRRTVGETRVIGIMIAYTYHYHYHFQYS